MAAEDTVRIICPNLKCRAILSVPSTARGKSVRCRSCGTRVSVPQPKSAAPKPPKQEETIDAEDSATTVS